MRKNGITLIATIMVIVLLAVIAFGILTHIAQTLILNISNLNSEKAFYMAQAGIMRGIADYITNGSLTIQSNVNAVAGSEFYYSVGDKSNSLLVDASDPKANGRVINDWPLKNISNASITVNSVMVEWDFVSNLDSMKLGNAYIFKGGSLSSPATINTSNDYNNTLPITIAAGANYNGTNEQYLQFTVNVPTHLTAAVTFYLDDGSSIKKYLVIGGHGANNEFSVKATGKVLGGLAGTFRRTLIATYDAGTGKITSWEESASHLLP